MTPEDAINAAIDKTGFPLENFVSQKLLEGGWTIISNKYYLDGTVDPIAREIDILAYKAAKFNNIVKYTTIIISCKKRDGNAFAFMVREKREDDPNIDWYPLVYWTNVRSIKYEADHGMHSKYYDHMKTHGVFDRIYGVRHHLFASQEINLGNGTPQNDKAIYDSIASLMKSQAYEIEALNTRKKGHSIYTFHLLTVADCDLYKVIFDKSGSKNISKIDSDNYLFNYIVGRNDASSQIRFVSKAGLAAALNDYDELHVLSAGYFNGVNSDFFVDILKNHEKYRVLIDVFEDSCIKYLKYFIGSDREVQKWNTSFSFDDNNKLLIHLNLQDEEIAEVVKRNYLIKRIALSLKNIYGYTGEFMIMPEEEPPF